MASMSSKSVSFAEKQSTMESSESDSDSSDTSDESDIPDYVESFSEGDMWSSSDEEHAELLEHLLEGACRGPLRSRLDPAERESLLLLDKDILKQEEEGEMCARTVDSVHTGSGGGL